VGPRFGLNAVVKRKKKRYAILTNFLEGAQMEDRKQRPENYAHNELDAGETVFKDMNYPSEDQRALWNRRIFSFPVA
jgi:hypothetical protein